MVENVQGNLEKVGNPEFFSSSGERGVFRRQSSLAVASPRRPPWRPMNGERMKERMIVWSRFRLRTARSCVRRRRSLCAGCTKPTMTTAEVARRVFEAHVAAKPPRAASGGLMDTMQALVAHLQKTQKPFRCAHPGCSAMYASKGGLVKHRRVKHEGHRYREYPKHHVAKNGRRHRHHECPHCPARFCGQGSLTRHVDGVHLDKRNHVWISRCTDSVSPTNIS